MRTLFERIREDHKSFLEGVTLSKFHEHGETVFLKKGQVITNTQDEIIIAINGGLSLTMDPELNITTRGSITTHSLLFFTMMPYTILGYANIYATKIPLYYYVEQDIAVVKISRQEFEENFLHKDAQTRTETFTMLSFSAAYMLDIINERTGAQGYDIVRSLIYRYNAVARETSINKHSLSSYIIKRSKLSRSYVFKILSELKIGGYISMLNGALLSINVELPMKF
ncbi:helix-turn-helix domain-containing protein [Enterobacteriaceae bacterium H11S18]|uniref:helix-turn-helix domain-containing protein n=1 Tax=Dryocola clanedunensis TaxID=2925396 RepID=UPI0022F07A0D|nr:helix-turn-helix domain-containing protein [Dryocola clanedunensis]MCT4713392.1 helix-turn-helix domain-containing protein [Dryocola clanedunensis]